MGMQKIEFEFPDEEGHDVSVEPSSFKELDLDKPAKSAKPAEKDDVEYELDDEADASEDDDDDLDIEVVDDTPPEDRNRKPSEPPEEVTDDELEQYSEKVKKRIRHFTKAYHDERREKEKAARQLDEMRRLLQSTYEENKTLKGSVGQSQKALLEQAKSSLQEQYENAKKAYAAAYDSGDTEKFVDAQEKLSDIKLRLERVNNFKLPPLQEDDAPVKETSQEQSKGQRPKVSEKAQAWAEDNASWFQKDEEMTAAAMGAHLKLVRSGVEPDSDEYYEKLNSRMRKLYPEQFDDIGDDDEPVQEDKPRKTSRVAAATRTSPPKKVRLTKTQVSIAKELGIPLKEYAKQVAKEMLRSGKNG